MLIAGLGFAVAAVVVLLIGPRMARTADRLAEATGMGGALFGVVFLALATDLPELVFMPTAVLSGSPKLAVGSLLGSVAAQLMFIAVADIAFRKGRLHAHLPVSSTIGQCGVMLAVLAVPLLLARSTLSIGPVGVGTVLLAATYVGGLTALRRIRDDASAGSIDDASARSIDDASSHGAATGSTPVAALWRRFGLFAGLLAGAGILLEATTEALGSELGLDETTSGALLSGVVTALPELVTAVAAVRSGAVALGVGDLIGSSALDVALLSVADVFYLDGSIFGLLAGAEFTLLGMALSMTTLTVLGIARRERAASSPIAIESYLMLAVYAGGAVMLLATVG